MAQVIEVANSDWHRIGDGVVRLAEVQAWRYSTGTIYIWLRYRKECLSFTCDFAQAKAFELAIKST